LVIASAYILRENDVLLGFWEKKSKNFRVNVLLFLKGTLDMV